MKLLTSPKMFFDSGRKTKQKFSVKDGQRLLAFSQRYRRSAFICSMLIQAIFPFLKRLVETKSEIGGLQFLRLTQPPLQQLTQCLSAIHLEWPSPAHLPRLRSRPDACRHLAPAETRAAVFQFRGLRSYTEHTCRHAPSFARPQDQ